MVRPSQEHIVAIDSVVVITQPDNPIKRIGMDDLVNIFSGKTINWAQLSGPNVPINVLDRQKDVGTRSFFADRVFGQNAPTLASATLADNNTEMAKAVAKKRG